MHSPSTRGYSATNSIKARGVGSLSPSWTPTSQPVASQHGEEGGGGGGGGSARGPAQGVFIFPPTLVHMARKIGRLLFDTPRDHTRSCCFYALLEPNQRSSANAMQQLWKDLAAWLVIQSNRDTLLSSGRISSALNTDAWWATLVEGVGDSSKRRGVDKVTTLAVACKKRQPIRIFASTRDQVETPLPLGEAHDKIGFVVCHENSGGFEHFFCTQLVPTCRLVWGWRGFTVVQVV